MMSQKYLFIFSRSNKKPRLNSEPANTVIIVQTCFFDFLAHSESESSGREIVRMMLERPKPTKKFIICPENIADKAIIWYPWIASEMFTMVSGLLMPSARIVAPRKMSGSPETNPTSEMKLVIRWISISSQMRLPTTVISR